MGNTPLKLDWTELLPGRDEPPPPDVEVVSVQASDLSDHQLQEKIQRLSNNITSGLASRLPDRGEKLRSSLRQLTDEVDRRSLARIQKDVGECMRATQSKSMKSSDSVEDFGPSITSPESRSQSSSGKLEDKTDAAFGEELRFITRDKYKSRRENGLQMQEERQLLRKSSHPARISSKELPSVCYSEKDKQIFFHNNSRDIGLSCTSSSHAGINLSRRLSKRRRAANRDSTNLEFKKVQHVVLLDDEDVQPIHAIKDDDRPDEWKEYKIYYPSRDDPESVELSYSDIKCLDPESYLSSPIMNFYIQYGTLQPAIEIVNHTRCQVFSSRYLQRSLLPIGRRRGKYYIFNTYFYRKLEEAMSCKDDRTASFLKLRRWWKGVDIFQKAYIFLPIHGDQHWSLVIICIPAEEDGSGPIILHLDSLGLHTSNQILSIVDSYLKEEWNYINQNGPPRDLPISERIWKHLPCRIEKKKIMVPQQKNDYDCGLFVLYFMERFIREAPERLRKKDLSMFGSKWFKPEEASGLRSRIRELLIEEFERNMLENGIQESSTFSGTYENDEEQGSKS